jgi:hypothetical protein
MITLFVNGTAIVFAVNVTSACTLLCLLSVDCVWNVMAHAQKPDFVFRRNGRVHLNRRGASVQSTTGSLGVRISCSNAGYTMFRCSVKSTGYPLHSPVSPSLPLSYVTVCHHISTGLYHWFAGYNDYQCCKVPTCSFGTTKVVGAVYVHLLMCTRARRKCFPVRTFPNLFTLEFPK